MSAPVAQDVSVGEVRNKLTDLANELEKISSALHRLEKEGEHSERTYEDAVADFEVGMFEKWEKGEGKWPGEEVRERLARRTMDQDLKRDVDRIRAARKRADKRIAALKSEADSWRSILSALKSEVDATR